MRKFCVFICCLFAVGTVFAAGENIPTSKSYVDSALLEKQDTIERTTGNAQALTNTGVAGEYGTKNIYDSTGSYTEQTDALVDAATMNTAVQNAIDSEFQCIEWVDNDQTKDCLLMMLAGRNLFDPTTNPIEQGSILSGGGGNQDSVGVLESRLRTSGYINVLPNTRYKIQSNIPYVFVFYYRQNGQYINSTGGWQALPYTFQTGPSVGKIRISLKYNSNTDDHHEGITPSDLHYLIVESLDGGIYIPNGQ